MTVCSALNCRNRGVHIFPKDVKRRKQWEDALRIKNFRASKTARLCAAHFKEEDYFGKSIYQDINYVPQAKFLRKTAVPSLFNFTKIQPPNPAAQARQKRLEKKSQEKIFKETQQPQPSSWTVHFTNEKYYEVPLVKYEFKDCQVKEDPEKFRPCHASEHFSKAKSLHQDHSYHIDLELEEVNYNSVLKKFNIGNGQFVATKPEVRSHDPLDHKIDIKINKENDIHDIQEITEVIKIETPDDEDLPDDVGLPDDEVLPYDGAFLDDMVLPDDVVLSDKYDLPASQPEDLNTLLGSDDFAASGFGPLVRPGSSYMLPIINMFAVMEFIAANDHYCKLNYQKLKELARKEQHKLLSNLRVQSCVSVHRIRGTIHLETSALCAIEYDVRTHTVTRSECMACPLATCPHVAALLMWLYAASNRPTYDPKFVIDDDDISTGTSKHVHAGGNTKVTIELPPKPAVSARAGVPGLRDPAAGAPGLRDPAAGAPGPGDPATGAPGSGDPADEDEAQLVDEETPGPSTAKRKKMPLPKVTPRYTATISKTKSVPKETDDNTGDSIIKCSFTRKCFFDVWRSTTGSSTERVAHTRTIMTEAFRDPEYVIDFQPLERRLELLCTELEGYWNADTNKPSFESKHMEWLTDTEYIEMKKQKRVINNKVFKKRVFTKKI